jgi:hypothetical protein
MKPQRGTIPLPARAAGQVEWRAATRGELLAHEKGMGSTQASVSKILVLHIRSGSTVGSIYFGGSAT